MCLIQDETDLAALRDEEDDYRNVKSQLDRVINKNRVGTTCWSFAVQDMLVADSEDIMQKHLEALSAIHITTKAILECKKAMKDEINELTNIELLPGTRETTVMYRNFPIAKQTFGAISTEMDKQIWSLLKGIGVELGMLPALWCEALLPTVKSTPAPVGIDPAVLGPAIQVRSQIDKFRKGQGEQSSAIVELLEKRFKNMKQTDAEVDVEYMLMREVCKDKAGKLLAHCIMSKLPSAENAVTPAQAALGVKSVVDSAVFKLAVKSAQGKVGTLQKMLGVLCEGRCPVFTEARGDPWLAPMALRFDYFFRKDVHIDDPEEDDDAKKMIFGSDAVAADLVDVEADFVKNKVESIDLNKFETYGWLLSEPQRKVVDSMLETLDAQVPCVVPKSGQQAKAKAGKKGAPPSEKDKSKLMAHALFKKSVCCRP